MVPDMYHHGIHHPRLFLYSNELFHLYPIQIMQHPSVRKVLVSKSQLIFECFLRKLS